MKPSITRALLIFVGTFGVIVTTAYDFFRPGPAEFGRTQFMGFIISGLHFIQGRTSSLNDFAANGMGVGVGVLYYHLEGKIFGGRHEPPAR